MLGISLLLAALHGPGGDPTRITALVAYALFIAGIVAASGSDAPLAVVGAGWANWAVVLGCCCSWARSAGCNRGIRRSAER